MLIDIQKNYKELTKTKFPKKFNYLSLFYYSEDSSTYEPLDILLDNNDLKERKTIFLHLLHLIVKTYHEQFLFREKIICPFDPLIEKTWHHNFNVERECKDIPLREFPPPKEKIQILENSMKNLNIKDGILKDAIEKTLNQKENIKIIKENKYVSKEFMNKMKRKKEIKEIIKY